MEFPTRLASLSDGERSAMLRIFDELVPNIPEGSAAVNRELSELRRARKAGGRRTRSIER